MAHWVLDPLGAAEVAPPPLPHDNSPRFIASPQSREILEGGEGGGGEGRSGAQKFVYQNWPKSFPVVNPRLIQQPLFEVISFFPRWSLRSGGGLPGGVNPTSSYGVRPFEYFPAPEAGFNSAWPRTRERKKKTAENTVNPGTRQRAVISQVSEHRRESPGPAITCKSPLLTIAEPQDLVPCADEREEGVCWP